MGVTLLHIFIDCFHFGHVVFGTGFIDSKRNKDTFFGFEQFIPRLACLRLRRKIFNYSIINVHAPPEMSSEEKEYELYEVLEETYENLHKNDKKLTIREKMLV
jgi:hypothetical protein